MSEQHYIEDAVRQDFIGNSCISNEQQQLVNGGDTCYPENIDSILPSPKQFTKGSHAELQSPSRSESGTMCSSKKLHDDYLFDDDDEDDDSDDYAGRDRNPANSGISSIDRLRNKLRVSSRHSLRTQNSKRITCAASNSDSQEDDSSDNDDDNDNMNNKEIKKNNNYDDDDSDEDAENEIDDGNEKDNYWSGSLHGDAGDFGTQAFIKVIQQQIDEIPSMKRIDDREPQRDSDRMISSLRELPSHTAAKTNFLLGERTPNYFDAMDMDGGIDEIDEINEADDAGEMSKSEVMRNHRRKATANPIYQCDEIRLRFRVDSMNQSDENVTHNEDNEDEVISNLEALKQNHRSLKMNKRMMSHKSCIDL